MGALPKLSPSRGNAAHFPVDPRPGIGRSPRKPPLSAPPFKDRNGGQRGSSPCDHTVSIDTSPACVHSSWEAGQPQLPLWDTFCCQGLGGGANTESHPWVSHALHLLPLPTGTHPQAPLAGRALISQNEMAAGYCSGQYSRVCAQSSGMSTAEQWGHPWHSRHITHACRPGPNWDCPQWICRVVSRRQGVKWGAHGQASGEHLLVPFLLLSPLKAGTGGDRTGSQGPLLALGANTS